MRNSMSIIIIIAMIFGSCKKEENDLESQAFEDINVSISGFLTTGDSTKPLVKTNFELRYIETDFWGFQILDRLKAQTSTDTNGNYYMEFKITRHEMYTDATSIYRLDVDLTDEFLHASPIFYPYPRLRENKDIIWNCYYPYNSELRFNIKGFESMPPEDYILLKIQDHGEESQLNPQYPSSSYAKREFFRSVPAEQQIRIFTTIFKNNTESRRIDTVYLEKNDTLDINIEYN